MLEEYLNDRVGAESSFISKRKLLRQFHKYLTQQRIQSIQDLRPRDIEKWLVMIQGKYSQSSINQWQMTIHDYLEWHVKKGLLLSNPFLLEWKNIKHIQRAIKVPNQEEVRQRLSLKVKTNFPIRDQAIIELLYSTGLRLSELMNLTLNDFIGFELRVKGKGNKERIIPVGHQACKAVQEYIHSERKQTEERLHRSFYGLFISCKTGESLKRSSIQTICRKYGFHPHELRHCCALHMLRNGASSAVIQKLLGHTRIETVQIYTQLETKDTQGLIDTFSPLEA